MPRPKTEEDVLALQRASRLIEELEDPRARARVAQFLYAKYTRFSESILPLEERKEYASAPEVDPRQMALPHTATEPTATPAAVAVAATSPTGATAPERGTGWDCSGRGSEHDDDPMPPSKPQPKTTRARAVDGGWELGNDEVPDGKGNVEVKI